MPFPLYLTSTVRRLMLPIQLWCAFIVSTSTFISADENNSRLELYEGTPTILEISAIPIQGKMENELNVTCNSEISEFHPKNSPTDFKPS